MMARSPNMAAPPMSGISCIIELITKSLFLIVITSPVLTFKFVDKFSLIKT